MRKVYRNSPEYVTGLFSETDGKDITEAAVRVGLSADANHPPTSWVDPDVLTHPTVSTARASMLVDSDTPPGTYVLWLQVTDSPEILARACRNEMIQVV